MYRIDSAGHASNMFTNGDPLTGTPATVLDAAWLNEVQEEIISVLVAAGVTPTKGVVTQLLAAIVKKNGDTMTGNLSIVAPGTRTLTQDATGNSSSSIMELKGRDSGGTTVWLRLIADLAGVCGLVVVSNHGWNIKTNNVDRIQISASGQLTKMAIGYESAEQTITSASVITLAHGLPTVPRHIWAVLKCITTEHGHAVGTELTLPMNATDGTEESGVQLSVVSTNLYLNIGTDPIKVYTTAGGVGASITNAKWKIIVRANP